MDQQKRDDLPATGFLRLRQILGDKDSDPPAPPLIPISRSSWFRGIKEGRYPKPSKKFGPRIAAYSVEDIRKLIESTGDVKP